MGDALSIDVALVADAGTTVGLGHLARCSGIAVALRCRGVNTVCRSYGADAPSSIDGVDWEPIRTPDELQLAAAASLTLVDSYRLDQDPAGPLAGAARLAFIYDHGPIPQRAELIVDPAAPEEARREGLLAGPGYAPLRPAYWGLPRRETSNTVERVLVTAGSGVSPGAGAAAARVAKEVLPAAAVALVVGPYEQPEAPPGVELVVAPPSLRAELMRADLVISAAGQTMLEAAAVGAPCVALTLFDNQRRNAMLLEKRGAVLVVESSGVALGRAVTDLAEDAARRGEMARRSQEAVDGYGAHRIAFEIERLLEMPGAPG